MKKSFKESFMKTTLENSDSHIKDTDIKDSALDEIADRIIKRAQVGGIYTYTELVSGINFGTDDKPLYINYDDWGNGHNRALIGAYLFHVDKRYLEEADCLLGMLVVTQQDRLPSGIVRKWLYGLNAFYPNTEDVWVMFYIEQLKAIHAWAKSKR